jgi:hypothetical protein
VWRKCSVLMQYDHNHPRNSFFSLFRLYDLLPRGFAEFAEICKEKLEHCFKSQDKPVPIIRTRNSKILSNRNWNIVTFTRIFLKNCNYENCMLGNSFRRSTGDQPTCKYGKKLSIDSPVSIGIQGKYKKHFSFPWPPLEAAMSIMIFRFIKNF